MKEDISTVRKEVSDSLAGREEGRRSNVGKFLSAIFEGQAGFVEFRQFRDGECNQRFYPLPLKTLPNLFTNTHDVFFGVAPRVRRDGHADAVKITGALWLDVDAKAFHGGKAEALGTLRHFGDLTPSIIVDSGNGYHAYWLLVEPMEIGEARLIMEALRHRINSRLDDVSDPSRILRVPGTFNHKNDAALPVKIVNFEPERRFDISSFGCYLDFEGANSRLNSNRAGQEAQPLATRRVNPDELLQGVPQGQRNQKLFQYICSLEARGMEKAETLALAQMAAEKCKPSYPSELGEEPIWDMVERVYRTYRKKSERAEQAAVDSAPYFGGESGTTFIPLRLARAVKASGTYLFGFDPERGAGQLMEYSNGVWRPATSVDIEMQRRLGEEVRRARIEETIAALNRDVDRRPFEAWNTHRRLINCLSGMLDPLALELKPHSPEYYSTMQIPVRWNPQAECGRLEKFLREVLPEDCIELAFMMLGYLLIPDITADKLFVLQGPANAGKTTFLSAVQALIGERNTAVISLQDLAENRFAAAGLENKLLCVFDDLDNMPLRSAAMLKVLTGGFSRFRVERKGQDAYEAPLYARMLFTCNEMPTSPDKTRAWYRRVCLIPLEKVVPREQRDPDLVEKLTTSEAKEALFTLVVMHLGDLIRKGLRFPEPESVQSALKDYKGRNDTVVAFVQERCVVEKGYRISRTRWYEAYKAWCEENSLRHLSRMKAYRRLRAEFSPSEPKGGLDRFFEGIGLRDE